MNGDNAHNPTASQSEDLFDFPVVEMQADGSTQARPSAPAPAPAAAVPAPAPKAEVAPKPKPAAKPAPKPIVKPKPAAELEAPAPAPMAAPAPTPPRSSPSKAWVMIVALSALNLGGFVFLWSTNRSVQHSLDALRAAQPATTTQTTTATAAPQNVATPAPLQSFDQLALTLARQELDAGDVAGARRRLARLLAVIDQVDPQARAVVEAEAMYLSAQAYEQVLHQRLEGKP